MFKLSVELQRTKMDAILACVLFSIVVFLPVFVKIKEIFSCNRSCSGLFIHLHAHKPHARKERTIQSGIGDFD